jgi:E3 ubiquitin-protein ligase TRIP12
LINFPACADFTQDGSKVEAQTPDGTRVATPNVLSISTPQGSTKTSYASALKAKPTDWHLEFSMDNQVLPLDLTIYGAIHQHEIRKKSGTVPQSLIWQGVYTVTFKKVPGPVPIPESKYTPESCSIFLTVLDDYKP